MEMPEKFNPEQIRIVTKCVELAEELVSNYYKMSANQWLRPTYDVKTLSDLSIEETLRKKMGIPVFHDKKHGAATVVAAALINALEVQKKRADEVRLVIAGAGPSGIGSADLLLQLGCVSRTS